MHDQLGSFRSTSLAGVEMAIPADLAGPTLVVFAYRQHQQADVDTWIRVVSDDDRVRVLEVPLLGRKWLPTRRFIDGGMASGMDAQTRRQTMCVYTDVARFQREVLGVTSGEVLATLVDAAGTVHWHALGPAGPADAAGLQAAVEALT